MTMIGQTDARDAAAARLQPQGETTFAGPAGRRVAGRVVWAVTIVVATMVALSWGAAVSRAADYQDANANVCEGSNCFNGSLVANNSFQNVAFGPSMMNALAGGSSNVAIGPSALQADTTGTDNLAIGTAALISNTTGSDNLASGFQALLSNTTGNENLASGTGALFSNTSGHDNLASGFHALQSSNGSYNLAAGTSALQANTTGIGNLASGYQALLSNTTGNNNVASGYQALRSDATGAQNVASGYQALYHDTGASNTALGGSALSANTTGTFNLALGRLAGTSLTTGSNNIEIANTGVAAESGTTRIGTAGTQTKAFLAGVKGVSIPGPTQTVLVNSSGQLGTATSSSARLKQDIRPLAQNAARVLDLHPVSYRYKPANAPAGNPLQYGLIAEQVKRVFPALVQSGPDRKPSGVYYQELPVLLLAQLQSEHARVSRQQHQIGQLEAQLEALRTLVVHHH